MTSIGSSPGVGSGSPVDTNALRQATAASQSAANASTTASTGANSTPASAPATSSAASAQIVTSTALNAGQIPVDNSRVSAIKKAIETGTYPLVPAKISDAMIAAGLLLRSAR